MDTGLVLDIGRAYTFCVTYPQVWSVLSRPRIKSVILDGNFDLSSMVYEFVREVGVDRARSYEEFLRSAAGCEMMWVLRYFADHPGAFSFIREFLAK